MGRLSRRRRGSSENEIRRDRIRSSLRRRTAGTCVSARPPVQRRHELDLVDEVRALALARRGRVVRAAAVEVARRVRADVDADGPRVAGACALGSDPSTASREIFSTFEDVFGKAPRRGWVSARTRGPAWARRRTSSEAAGPPRRRASRARRAGASTCVRDDVCSCSRLSRTNLSATPAVQRRKNQPKRASPLGVPLGASAWRAGRATTTTRGSS